MKKRIFKTFGTQYISVQASFVYKLILQLLFCYCFYSVFVYLPLFDVIIPVDTGEQIKYPLFFIMTLYLAYNKFKSGLSLQNSYYIFPELIITYGFYNLFVTLSLLIGFMELLDSISITSLVPMFLICLISLLYYVYKQFLLGQNRLVNRDFVYKRSLNAKHKYLVCIYHLYLAYILYQFGYFNPYYWLRSY